ncbi:MAG: hypothetical protein ACTHM7_15790, partial [Ginsengibacter sp.]
VGQTDFPFHSGVASGLRFKVENFDFLHEMKRENMKQKSKINLTRRVTIRLKPDDMIKSIPDSKAVPNEN